MIGWRVLQALGGSMLTANSAAILTDAFPRDQRGLALVMNQVAGIAGQVIGLVAGGLLAALDWRAVFWVNVPVGVFGTVWAYRKLRDTGKRQPGRIDWWGNVTFAVGLAAILIAVRNRLSWNSGSATRRSITTKAASSKDWTELVPELQPQPDDNRVTKQRWGAVHETSLDASLRDLGVTQVVLAGVATSAGVESTARSAHEHGYHVVLATDAITDTDADAHENSIERIFPRLGETTTTAEILTMLESSLAA